MRERRKLEERGRFEVSATLGMVSFEGETGWLSKLSASRVSGEES